MLGSMSLEAAREALLAELASGELPLSAAFAEQGLELPQSREPASTVEHHNKQEPNTAFSVDVDIKHESEIVPEVPEQQTQNIPLIETLQESGLNQKSLQPPDIAFAVHVEVKHDFELSSEVPQVQDNPFKRTDADRGSLIGVKPLQGADKIYDAAELACDSDAVVADSRALRRIVAGCFVPLQRLRLLPCDLCGAMFIKRSQLVAHFIDHHAGDETDTDSGEENCAPNFFSDDTATSSTLKLYPCNICHEQFAFRRNMMIHKLKHWGKEPLTCDICKKDFARKSYLIQHMATHFDGPDTGAKPIPCEICNKNFTNQLKLKSHIKRHTRARRFACKICEKRFPMKSNLSLQSAHGRETLLV